MFKRQRTDVHFPHRTTIVISATALPTWINKKPSDLKLLMMIFGSNGLSHNAQVYEKCLRAHVDHRKFGQGSPMRAEYPLSFLSVTLSLSLSLSPSLSLRLSFLSLSVSLFSRSLSLSPSSLYPLSFRLSPSLSLFSLHLLLVLYGSFLITPP